jgi:hypothetical protein
MAFPFGFEARLRQQFLLAIGTTGMLAAAGVGCGAKHEPLGTGGRAGELTAGRGASGAGSGAQGGAGSIAQAGAGSVASGGAGSVASAGAGAQGGAGSLAPAGAGGAVATAGKGAAMCMFGQPARECYSPAIMKSKATFGCGQIPISPVPTAEEVDAKFLANGCLKGTSTCNGCCNPAVGEGEPQADGSCCYTFCAGACCGRPFIVDDAPRVAAVESRSDWSGAYGGVAELGPVAERIAAEWLEDARMEHASIASFARFTLDLLAYGAPAGLVEAAQRAGLDECEHAKLCFGLAARFGAGVRGPSQLMAAGASVAPSLWHAAAAAFREGCVSETFAALQASEACERATDPEVKRALERIAADEASHAELAWRFVAWSVARLGGDFAAELRREIARLKAMPEPRSETESVETKRALNAAGRLTATDKHRLDYTAVHEVIAPVLEALLA